MTSEYSIQNFGFHFGYSKNLWHNSQIWYVTRDVAEGWEGASVDVSWEEEYTDWQCGQWN